MPTNYIYTGPLYTTTTSTNTNTLGTSSFTFNTAFVNTAYISTGSSSSNCYASVPHYTPDPNWINVGDKVSTAEGEGEVWFIDEDDTICVELDKDAGVCYEFDRNEITKIGAKK